MAPAEFLAKPAKTAAKLLSQLGGPGVAAGVVGCVLWPGGGQLWSNEQILGIPPRHQFHSLIQTLLKID